MEEADRILLRLAGKASSLPPASALEFHETASACESRSTRLDSRSTFPTAILAECSGGIKVGMGLHSSGEAHSVVPGKLSLLKAAVPTGLSLMAPAHHVADLQRRLVGLSLTAMVRQWEASLRLFLLPTPAAGLAFSINRGRVSMPRVRSLEHKALQEWSLFNSLPPDARQNSPSGYSRQQKRGESRKGR
ncbi:hypothetical protein EYF80_006808 [Liparis tanakae]|uniref:Uncharacterized protein n=1 Tax=Liparis tanakae TaxID=230148 RepID=A0A4Z2IYJ9_9TELE|nr:hypothetical protein EYF80_006808 [Liparis tanakae]